MKTRSRFATIGIFVVRFAVIAAICLPTWWYFLLPVYAGAVGQVCARTLMMLGEPIEAVSVSVDETSVLREKTSIILHKAENRETRLPIASLVNSLPPFIILVLTTAGLGLRRRLKIMAIGTAIFFAGHVSWIVIGHQMFQKSGASTEILTAYGQFWLTVPLILWIALAYRDKVAALFDDTAETPEDPETEK